MIPSFLRIILSFFTDDTGFLRMVQDLYGQYWILTDDTQFFTDDNGFLRKLPDFL
jgi:hypothetical protein